MHPNPRVIIPVLLLICLAIGGWYIDQQRAKTRSTLSGFFETLPTEVSSRQDGRVAGIDVHEGDQVFAGQVLINLEAKPAIASLRSKVFTAEQAHAQYLDVLSGTRPEEIMRQESVVAELTADLAKMRHGSRPEEIAEARANLDAAESAYEKAFNGPRTKEIQPAQAAASAAWERWAIAKRGPTAEERAEAKARLDAASALAAVSVADAGRYADLYAKDAITKQQLDQVDATRDQALANQREMRQAYKRSMEGNPPEELGEAQQEYLQARDQYVLLRQGTRPEDISAAKAQRDSARSAYSLAVEGPRTEDIAAAQARLDQSEATLQEMMNGETKAKVAAARMGWQSAEAAVRSAEEDVDEHVVRAPRDGVVDRILVADGDLVTSGVPVVRLIDPADLWMRVYVPEAELSKISVGSKGDLAVDGIDGDVHVVVDSISTVGEFTPVNLQTPDERGKQVFGVRLRLAVLDPRIKPGMYATVERLGEITR